MSLIIKSLLGQRDQFNTQKFRSQISAFGGPASPANFYVEVITPPILSGASAINKLLNAASFVTNIADRRIPLTFDYDEKATKEIPRDLKFLASTASIPGKTLSTNPIKDAYWERKMPYADVSDNFSVSFYVRTGLLERFFFDAWQRTIINTGYSSVSSNKNSLTNLLGDALKKNLNGQLKDNNTFKDDDAKTLAEATQEVSVGWYQDYVSEVNLYYFDPDGENTFKIKFMEAYPTAITAMPLSWSQKNDFMQMNVQFAYWEFDMQAIQPGDVKNAAYFAKGLREGNLRQAAGTILNLAKKL